MFTKGNYSLEETVAPTEEPIDIGDAKLFAKIDENDDDALVLAMISTARRECENLIGRQLLTATKVFRFDDFAASFSQQKIPRPPLQSISLFRYKDTSDTWATLVDGTDYDLHVSEPAFVTPTYGNTWPTVLSHPLSVELTFVCGWETPEDIPANLLQWIRLRVATLFEHREAFVLGTIATPMPDRFFPGLLDPHWIRDLD